MSLQHVIRLRLPTDSLVIGHRVAFGRARNLLVPLDEDTVHRRLVALMSDSTWVETLRRFWHTWQDDPIRNNVSDARDMIDRIAPLTASGMLMAYVAPHLAIDREDYLQRAKVAIDNRAVGGFHPIVGAQLAGLKVENLSEVELLLEVLQRAAGELDPAARSWLSTFLEEVPLTNLLAALAAWSAEREEAMALIIDAMLVGNGVVFLSSATAQAARYVYLGLEAVATARQEIEILEAALHFAAAFSIYGPKSLVCAILRNTVPRPGGAAGRPTPDGQLHQARRPPERFLERSRQASSASSASSSGPSFAAAGAQAQVLKDAASAGTPFCEVCAAR